MQTYTDLFGREHAMPVSVKTKSPKSHGESLPASPVFFSDRIPMLTVHPDRVTCYSVMNRNFKKTKLPAFEHLLKSERTSKGNVSDQARRKMSRAVDYLLLLANEKHASGQFSGRNFHFKIAFITLTLPSTQMHPDKDIKRNCLNYFLVELRRRWRVKNYLWRSEKQLNGNLHFHILVDKFIPWSELRDVWNRIVNTMGYVDRYRDELKAFHSGGFQVRKDLLKKWSYKSQLKAYKTGVANDWNSPNSTDIHSIIKIGNIKKYITKYMTKNENVDHETGEIKNENLAQTGRIWGCNRELSNIKGCQLEMDWPTSDELKQMFIRSNCDYYISDHFSVYFVDFKALLKFGCTSVYSAFCSYVYQEFGLSIQSSFN